MGNRLVTSPKGAMRMISQFNSLGQALAKTATELEVAHQTLDQRNREVADWERHHTNLTASYSEQGKNFDDLVYTVTKAITEILKTSRFRDSNEGARIRKLLSGGVKQVLDVGDPRIAGLRAIEESREKKPVKGGVLRQDQAHPRKPGS
ncbi:MAG: hypothetical protein NT041_00440 [Candidatus Vogelbacteria bacterium]|nr:hypothetical protein [Candidatus Vogelbacteria bacterium]